MNLKEHPVQAPSKILSAPGIYSSYVSPWIPGFRKLEYLPNLRKLPSKLPDIVSSHTPSWIYACGRSTLEYVQDHADVWPLKIINIVSSHTPSWIYARWWSIVEYVQDHADNMWPLKTIRQLKTENSQLNAEIQFICIRFYRVDLTLDPKTAHPRLKVSEDGKSVWDTGNIHDVSKSKERFESHTFVLAKQEFSEGRYYWEVEVGQNKRWDLGVASESAPRTGKITLSPQNGYWVIRRDGGKDYWALTDPWTSLDMPRKPTKIGIFLNTKSHKISFYDAQRKHELYTFLNVASGKFYPFFSTGSVIGDKFDNGTLIIPPWFEEPEVVEENEINN